MNEIHKALAIFGLEPGASQEEIRRRYKRLIMVWHPDRFSTNEEKKDAEEELKKINSALDLLEEHFADGHHAGACVCETPATDDAEAAAKRRDDDRRQSANADAKTAERANTQQDQAACLNFEQAQKQQQELKWNRIRWQIAAGEAALFIVLCIFGSAGYEVKEWWQHSAWKWEHGQALRK